MNQVVTQTALPTGLATLWRDRHFLRFSTWRVSWETYNIPLPGMTKGSAMKLARIMLVLTGHKVVAFRPAGEDILIDYA